MSERFEPFDEPLGFSFGVAALEVVAAEVGVELAGGEHVPAGDDDRVLYRAERLLVAAAGFEAGVLRGEVDVLAADRGECGLLERPVQPLRSLATLAGAAFAGGLVVAGALAGPRGEVPRRSTARRGSDHSPASSATTSAATSRSTDHKAAKGELRLPLPAGQAQRHGSAQRHRSFRRLPFSCACDVLHRLLRDAAGSNACTWKCWASNRARTVLR